MKKIKVVGFDADDTLWVNEPFFKETEKMFCNLLENFQSQETISRELFSVQIKNLVAYGYGVKSFILSMIETAIKISEKNIDAGTITKIITLGENLLDKPIVLIKDVEHVLKLLYGRYRIVMVTKGDILDQEKKLVKSGLEKYFHHIEIVSEKKEDYYKKLIKHLDIPPDEFLMIGNSLKSDILPVLNIGGYGFHVPYHTTWKHEEIKDPIEHIRLKQLNTIKETLCYL